MSLSLALQIFENMGRLIPSSSGKGAKSVLDNKDLLGSLDGFILE